MTIQAKPTKLLNGFLIVDKPWGLTSRRCVDRVQNRIGKHKSGHTGTLDPFATGILPVAVGRATKLVQYVNKLNKEYLADLRFGIETDTEDITGKILRLKHPNYFPKISEIESVLSEFNGEYIQRIPDYSARKVNGHRSFKLARKQKKIPPKSKRVFIKNIQTVSYCYPHLKFHVTCSTGTYVRVLGSDIGHRLGIPSTLIALRRLRVGNWDFKSAFRLSTLDRYDNVVDFWKNFGRSMEEAVNLPDIKLNQNESKMFRNAYPFILNEEILKLLPSHISAVKVFSNRNHFLGIGRIEKNEIGKTTLKVERLIDIE